jgi:uncharacterized protein YcbX
LPLTLSALHVYPVKGLKGIDLAAARCTDRGVEHDRRWMVVDSGGEFLSQREHPKMATVWTEIADGALSLCAPDEPSVEVPLDVPAAPTMRVRVWDSECDAVPASAAADRFLSEYLGLACRLVYMPESSERFSSRRFAPEGRRVGFADAFAYLLTTEASLGDLNSRLIARSHAALPMNRFRPNLVISGNAPYAEDGWGEIRIGEVLLRAVKPCGRCQVTTTDQATGEVKGPEPLATLATYRESSEFGVMFGVNLVTVKTGTVRVGDALEIA